MADSSLASLYYVEESNWGVTPASALKELRFTGENLKQQSRTTNSEEIRGDRQRGNPVRTSVSAGGGFGIELSYGSYDELIAGAMMNTWTAGAAVSATNISASNVDNSFNRASGSFISDGVVAGQYVKVGGGTGSMAANNGFWRVDSVTALKLVVSGGTITTASSGDTITMDGTLITNGTTKKSFSLEKRFNDVNEFFGYTGCRVARHSVDTRTEQKIAGRFEFLGKNEFPAGSTIGTGSPTAANTNETMDSVGGIALFHEGGADLAGGTDVQFSLDNKLRPRPALGVEGASEIGIGTISVTGSIQAYFASRALYEKRTNFTTSSLAVGLQDSQGRGYVYSWPSVKYTDGDILAQGVDNDVYAKLSFEAFEDSTLGHTMSVTVFE